MNNKIIYSLIFIFITTACGYTVVNKSNLPNFKIATIHTEGDKRIGYVLKNKLSVASKNDEVKIIELDININKKKSIKEKNIKNEVSKYVIFISTDVTFNEIGKDATIKFTIKKMGEYEVSKKYTSTIRSEKQLLEVLTNSLANDIFERLKEKINAL